jgi:hypothetical protein
VTGPETTLNTIGKNELAVACNPKGASEAPCWPMGKNTIVCEAGLTTKLWVTGAAAAKVPFPPCVAVIEQVPAERMVTRVPLNEQTKGVAEEKLTVRPELAEALMTMDPTPKVVPRMAANVIVCAVWPGPVTVKLCETGAAALYIAFPDCVAVIEHTPWLRSVTMFARIEQTVGVDDVKLTGSPEVAVAVIANGALPIARLASAGKAIV